MSDRLRRHRSFQYTALGNSVAFGVGAKNHYGYVYYLRDFLVSRYHCVHLINRADPGFSSSDLLLHLQNDLITQTAVKDSDLITISIGGANLLHCLNAVNLTACLSNAIAAFTADWPKILHEIRKKLHADADILVMTVYNPFRGDDPNFKTIEFFIQQINRVITNPKFYSTYRYKVVDIHKDFQGKLTNGHWKVCTWTHFCEAPPDPHPTDSGHLEIARLHESVYLHRDKLD